MKVNGGINSQKEKSVPWTCPNCGQEYEGPRRHCRSCHYFSPDYWEPPEKRNAGKRTAIILLLATGVLATLLVLVLLPYLPHPRTFFHAPATQISSEPKPGDWTVYGRNAGHTRTVTSGPEITGQIRWSVDLQVPTESAPAVADGMLFVGGNFKVYALDAKTGRVIWEKETTGPVHSSPALADNLIFLGFLDGRIMALERSSGRTVWEFQSRNFIYNPGIVNRGLLYIGSGDRNFYALDASTGRVIWQRRQSGGINSTPAMSGDILYFATANQQLHSLNAHTGARRLCYHIYRDLLDTPVIANNMVYFVTRAGRLYTLRHGAREWPGRYQVVWLWTQFWLWYLPVPPPPKQPGALWRVLPQSRFRSFTTPPAVTEKALYIGDDAGIFYAFDALTGKPLWQYQADGPITAAPLVLADRVYFGDEGGYLYALKCKTGGLIRKINLGAPIKVNPVYAEGLLFVRTHDGLLHAIQ